MSRRKRDPYIMTPKGDEKGWREKIKANHPKSEIRSTGAGTLVATLPWPAVRRLGHYRNSLGGFVLRKGEEKL